MKPELTVETSNPTAEIIQFPTTFIPPIQDSQISERTALLTLKVLDRLYQKGEKYPPFKLYDLVKEEIRLMRGEA